MTSTAVYIAALALSCVYVASFSLRISAVHRCDIGKTFKTLNAAQDCHWLVNRRPVIPMKGAKSTRFRLYSGSGQEGSRLVGNNVSLNPAIAIAEADAVVGKDEKENENVEEKEKEKEVANGDQEQYKALFLLNFVAVLWGSQHVVIKSSLDNFPATSVVNFWRFASSSVLFLPALIDVIRRGRGGVAVKKDKLNQSNQKAPSTLRISSTSSISSVNEQSDEITESDSFKSSVVVAGGELLSSDLSDETKTKTNQADSFKASVVAAGVELGLYTFLGFALQAVGLETTTASRSAFLLYLNVKFVPFLAAGLLKRKITPTTWISASLALGGTCLLSFDGSPPNVGDGFCALAAGTYVFLFLFQFFHLYLTYTYTYTDIDIDNNINIIKHCIHYRRC